MTSCRDKTEVGDLALHGGRAGFAFPVLFGQHALPDRASYEASMRDIFARQYYTNQGPLVQQLEQRLSDWLGVTHAICVTNESIAMIMAAEALGLTGTVLVSALSSPMAIHSLVWAGLRPLVCDVDRETGLVTPEQLGRLPEGGVAALIADGFAAHAVGHSAMESWAIERGIPVVFDANHAFAGHGMTRQPHAACMTVHSFQAEQFFSTMEGGCITTQDDDLAARLRNIRSSYGSGRAVEVVKTSNGRMSEAQAALGLLNLERVSLLQRRNRERADLYRIGLQGLPGVRLLTPQAEHQDSQHIVCDIDPARFGITAEHLLAVLRAENVMARACSGPRALALPGVAGIARVPNADALARNALLLPQSSGMSDATVREICSLLAAVHSLAPRLPTTVKG